MYIAPELDLLIGDNIYDVTQWIASTPRLWRYDDSQSYWGGQEWDLGAGWAKSLAMSSTGWPQGVQKLAVAADLLPPQERKKLFTHYDVAGHVPDVGRFVMGDPMCMTTRRKKRAPTLVTSIVVNMSANFNVPASEFVNLGAAFASVINDLEEAGRRVELMVVHASRVQNSKEVCHGWWVKRAGDPLDLDQLAFAIAHPASFRRIGFAMRERTNPQYQLSNYGYTDKLSKSMIARLGVAEDAVIFDAADMWHVDTKSAFMAANAVARKIKDHTK